MSLMAGSTKEKRHAMKRKGEDRDREKEERERERERKARAAGQRSALAAQRPRKGVLAHTPAH
jgi:hypothetical protein